MICLHSFNVSPPKYLLNTKEENSNFVLKNLVDTTSNMVSGSVSTSGDETYQYYVSPNTCAMKGTITVRYFPPNKSMVSITVNIK